MKRILMAFTAIAAFSGPLAAPVQALAQEQPRRERPGRDADRAQRPQTSRQEQSRPRQAERPNRAAPERNERPDNNMTSRPDRRGENAQRPDRPSSGQRPDRPNNNLNNRPDRPNNGQVRPGQPNRPGSGWNQDRNRQRQEFRQRFNSDQWRREFNRNHRSDWWRYDRRFHGYSGVRLGFYFAPGWGYYSVPRSYWGRYWSVGQYLPDIFWRYRLDDWRTYGLGYPPAGTRWVLVDNTIYLIDEYDGYIIDVIRNAWRW